MNFGTVLGINLSGTYLMCKHFGKSMLTAGRGSLSTFARLMALYHLIPRWYSLATSLLHSK